MYSDQRINEKIQNLQGTFFADILYLSNNEENGMMLLFIFFGCDLLVYLMEMLGGELFGYYNTFII